jgi:hypothetical protein
LLDEAAGFPEPESELLVQMKRTTLCTAAFCGLLLSSVYSASAQTRQPFPSLKSNPKQEHSMLLFEADHLHGLTNFKGFRRGVDNRMNLFLQYSF